MKTYIIKVNDEVNANQDDKLDKLNELMADAQKSFVQNVMPTIKKILAMNPTTKELQYAGDPSTGDMHDIIAVLSHNGNYKNYIKDALPDPKFNDDGEFINREESHNTTSLIAKELGIPEEVIWMGNESPSGTNSKYGYEFAISYSKNPVRKNDPYCLQLTIDEANKLVNKLKTLYPKATFKNHSENYDEGHRCNILGDFSYLRSSSDHNGSWFDN